jgi:hypothetical protein
MGDFLPAPSTKVPKAPKSRAQIARNEEQWGKPTSARLTVSERAALEALAEDYETDLTQVMRLCLRIGVSAIEAGVFKPTFAETKMRRMVKMPALPDRFG